MKVREAWGTVHGAQRGTLLISGRVGSKTLDGPDDPNTFGIMDLKTIGVSAGQYSEVGKQGLPLAP